VKKYPVPTSRDVVGILFYPGTKRIPGDSGIQRGNGLSVPVFIPEFSGADVDPIDINGFVISRCNTMKDKDVKYIVFDVESVPDPRLIARVKYPEEGLDGPDAVKRFQEEVLETSGGASDFIPVTFQYPVSICVAKVRHDFTLIDVVCLDDPEFRPDEMVRLFWLGVEEVYEAASLVTFNGRGFDIPLLELMAYRYGYTAKRHFRDKFAGRYRFGPKHIDLHDWLSNYGAIRMHGGLNLLAKVIGKPGKTWARGDEVYPMFLEGRLREINDYCINDVLDTYFVFLRTRVLTGEISLVQEQDLVKSARNFLEANRERVPAVKAYLANWGDWEPWP
jgi:predicted PolB exonuclease-like 3'-5' exonuclease